MPPFKESVIKTRMVRKSMITQGLFLTRSFRSWETELFLVCAGTILSLVVRKVMMKKITPVTAKKLITVLNPAA